MEKKWAGEGSVTLAGHDYPVTYEITQTTKRHRIEQPGLIFGIPSHLVNEVMNAGQETLTLGDGRKVEVAILSTDPREPIRMHVNGDLG